MPELYIPQIAQPDVLGAYLRGRMAPGVLQQQQQQLAAGQQGLARGALGLDQLRMALQTQGILQGVAAQQLRDAGYSVPGQPVPQTGTAAAGAQNLASATGGVQTGPQQAVTGPMRTAPAQPSGSYDGSVGRPLSPLSAQAVALLQNRDPSAAYRAALQNQLQVRGLQIKDAVNTADTIFNSASPTATVKRNPGLMAMWNQYAATMHLDPISDFTDQNIRVALSQYANGLRSYAGQDAKTYPVPLQTSTDQYGRTIQTEPVSGKETVLPTPTLEKVITPDHPNGELVPTAQAAGMQPWNQWAANSAQMAGPVGALDAALVEDGINLPGGRGGQQYVLKLHDLIASNPGVPPQQIADQIRTGQLDFNGAKRSTAQLSTVLASANSYSKQLEKNLASLSAVAGKVDSTGVPILNRAFAAFRRNITGGPDIAQFTAYFNAVASEYGKLISGGVGVAAPNESSMIEARKTIEQAYTQGGLEGLQRALTTEANNKIASYQEGLRDAARHGASVGSPTPATPATAPAAASSGASPYASPADVKAAYQSGKITRAQAMSVLQSQFGMH